MRIARFKVRVPTLTETAITAVIVLAVLAACMEVVLYLRAP